MSGLSDDDVAKIVASTATEILSKLNLGKKTEEYSQSSAVKHTVPVLKKDDIDEYLAWSDSMRGLILQTDCGIALEEDAVAEAVKILGKHSDLRNLDPSDIKDSEILFVMRKNDAVMGYINSGLALREHRNCVAAAKTVEFPLGIAYVALKKLRQHYIPDSTMQKAGLKKLLRGIGMKEEEDPKVLGSALSRVKNMAIEAGITIDEADLVDQAVMALPKEYADAVIAAHKNAHVRGEPTLDEIMEAVRDHYEFGAKDDDKEEGNQKREVSLGNVDSSFSGDCYHCGEKGHKSFECPKKIGREGNSGPQIRGVCHHCNLPGHKAAMCWEKEENASRRPHGWVSKLNRNGAASSSRGADVTGVEILL